MAVTFNSYFIDLVDTLPESAARQVHWPRRSVQRFSPTHYIVARAAHLSPRLCCILKLFVNNHFKTKKNMQKSTTLQLTAAKYA